MTLKKIMNPFTGRHQKVLSDEDICKKETTYYNEYYVSPTGDDNNPGTSDLPFATIQHAIDNLPKHLEDSYNLIYLKDGTYTESQIRIVGFSGGFIDISSESYDATKVLIKGIYNRFMIMSCSTGVDFYDVSVEVDTNNSSALYLVGCSNVGVWGVLFGTNGSASGTRGINMHDCVCYVNEYCGDIDANKVAYGVLSTGIISFANKNITFGDSLFPPVGWQTGLITDGVTIWRDNYEDMLANNHPYPTSDFNRIYDNLLLNAFRIAINGSLTKYNMVDGIMDEFEDESGVDVSASTNEIYVSLDKYYSNFFVDTNTLALLHADGALDGDSSGSAHTPTYHSNAFLDTSQKKFGTASARFDGVDDAVSFPTHSDFDLTSTESWTIDYCLRLANTPVLNDACFHRGLSASPWTGYLCFFDSSGYLTLASSTSGLNGVRMSETLNLNTDYHIAFVHDNVADTLKIYVNGVQKASVTASTAIDWTNVTQSFYIGGQPSFGGRTMDGWIDEFRVSKGIARWTSNFTPPTSAYTSDANTKLLMHFDREPVVDSSPNSHVMTQYGYAHLSSIDKKFGDSSLFFPSSGSNSIRTASNSVFAVGTGDFTVEMEIKPTQISSQMVLVSTRINDPSNGIYFYINSNKLMYYDYSTGYASLTSVSVGVWQHVCVMRKSGTTYFFINGVEAGGSFAHTRNLTEQNFTVGVDSTYNNSHYQGYMDEVRFSDKARYAITGFTPPTSAHIVTQAPLNMSLVSKNTEAEENPDNVRTVIMVEEIDTQTINTDLKAYASRDDGANWVEASLSLEANIEGSKKVYAGTADVSGQASDKTIKWKIQTFNNKAVKIHGIGNIWD